MNNNLTKDMLRLRSEIVALRDRRSALLEAIGRDAAQLLASFSKARAEISLQTRAVLTASVTGLRQSVLELRRLYQVDLIGARQAWRGVGTKPRGKPMPIEPNVIAAVDAAVSMTVPMKEPVPIEPNVIAAAADTVPTTVPRGNPVPTAPAPKAKERSGKVYPANASSGKSRILMQMKKQLARPFGGRISK